MAQGFGRYEDAPGLLLRVRPPRGRGSCGPFRPAFVREAVSAARTTSTPPRSPGSTRADRPPGVPVPELHGAAPAWMAEPPFDRWVCDAAERARDAGAAATSTRTSSSSSRRTRSSSSRPTYDGQVAAMDAALGELVAALKARGRYENALIIVTPITARCSASTRRSATGAACSTSGCCTCRWS